ncbi:hypothetical protein [Nocardiopsis tropica]|uniref:tRNA-guanine(15) transglycosylase-like domain-containing protein n=1 Tax=Nocardiopsis tropica TaxID=109330 RepID=A0ABU7KSK4_9ACTN|nr:hypothetical protein [Nocardiopsis umidischolae]MEE2052269.1 hypothetical protein [Nocardiopsis umidischolae]
MDPARSGVILTGPKAYAKATVLTANKTPTGPLLIDPAAYESHAATDKAPFIYEVDEKELAVPTLFDPPDPDDPLEASIQRQRSAGVTACITPTGYLHAEDDEALLAAVRMAAERQDPDLILALPVDYAWLRDGNVDQLIAALLLYPGPKALMLGGQMDPLGQFAKAVDHLLRVLKEVPNCALLRTDLAAFGALAHGAVFTSFGVTSSRRHIVPPGAKAKTGPMSVSSPHVLFPELMSFHRGLVLADKFAADEPPTCHCSNCQYKGLDRFTDNKARHQYAAMAHNLEILQGWRDSLMALPHGRARQVWWYEACNRAKQYCEGLNAELQQKNAFKLCDQIKRWAAQVPTAVEVDVDATDQRTS